jgi:S-methyl-5-thioribose-1-phosphate isomerase
MLSSGTLQSLIYSRGRLTVIDQLKLPTVLEYVPVETCEDAFTVIRSMQVRGAPLIAIVAALGLAVELHNKHSANHFDDSSGAKLDAFLQSKMQRLREARPTAVNLFQAMDAIQDLVQRIHTDPQEDSKQLNDVIVNKVIEFAEEMLEKDLATNKSMGDFGAKRILELTGKERIRVLTICNTGSLATSGYGTALGVVRSLHAMGKLEHVYACETRPYNQGARLTAFEIVRDNLPGTLIADSMASALMALKGVDCVIVGADRVAANGDTANKIGTYQLAITAKYHGVPFFTAVPTTTLDLSMSNGSLIHIEQRPSVELTSIFGKPIAPEGIAVWNPSFDVTPSSLITGIITELGVAEHKGPVDGTDSVIDMKGKHLAIVLYFIFKFILLYYQLLINIKIS